MDKYSISMKLKINSPSQLLLVCDAIIKYDNVTKVIVSNTTSCVRTCSDDS